MSFYVVLADRQAAEGALESFLAELEMLLLPSIFDSFSADRAGSLYQMLTITVW